ncbi:MAG TPA: hypothetical protein VG649_22030 [Candidatus Angelobacter sp.]|jgi:hypothetical protein|nr:hypothetical protein [Candidatus Angelobacter sp.]
MDMLPHPSNQELFNYLVANWQSRGFAQHELGAISLAHPDLVVVFDSLVDELDESVKLTKATIYGIRLAATSYHLVFAWAKGVDAIFVELRPERHKEALAMGGRLDATYPPNWVEFLAGGTRMPAAQSSQWRDVIRYWMQVSYTDSLEGTATQKTIAAGGLIPPPPLDAPKQVDQVNSTVTITLTLSARLADLDSLAPLCVALLPPETFEAAKHHITRTRSGLTAVSDTGDLSIRFPDRPNNLRFLFLGGVMGFLVGANLFRFGVAPLLCALIGGLLVTFAAFLISLFQPEDMVIRGPLDDVRKASDALCSWLSAGTRRKARLEVLDKTYIKAEARRPEDVTPMFRTAASLQEEQRVVTSANK